MRLQASIKILTWAMLAVLSAAAQTTSQAPPKPLTRAQILALLAGDVPTSRVTTLVQERGVDFAPNDAYLEQVRKGGGEDDLVQALQSARVTKNASATPVSAAHASQVKLEEAKQEELAQHMAQGAELFLDHHYAEAEAEYRAAVKLDPQNSDLHMALARALNSQKKKDEGMQEAHEAIRLNPESDMAHFALGNSLRMQEDWDGAAAEFREAIRLNPQEELALGNLGNALDHQGDWDGAVAQFQQLSRLRPKLPGPHFRLGQLFEKNGEMRRAVREFREATELAPDNRQFRAAYEHALRNQ